MYKKIVAAFADIKKNKYFLIISCFIVLSDLIFITINYFSSLDSLKEDVKTWAEGSRQMFNLTLEQKATNMQQIATYVANNPKIQQLFLNAKNAHDSGDKDLEDKMRVALYNSITPGWQAVVENYDVRQLHFHFGPGSNSFLRVHRPTKHSDNMDNVRFTIVDANKKKIPTKGFETGRVYSGIRGVVPMFAFEKDGTMVHTGALEAGTSFTSMLNQLYKELSCNFAILLSKDHVQRNMWPAFVEKHFSSDKQHGNFYFEYTTSKQVSNFLDKKQVYELALHSGFAIVHMDKHYQVTAFPLRDYKGQIDPDHPDAGVVLIWQDISPKWQMFKKQVKANIVFAVIALLIVEIILAITMKYSRQKLHDIIESQTQELRKLSITDALTDIYNRRAMDNFITCQQNHAERYSSTFSLMLLDIDHFKNVNDNYGHDVGDMVLQRVSNIVLGNIREADLFGRWGGEEFIIIAVATDIKGALIIAEKVRTSIGDYTFEKVGNITVSIGVTQYQPNETVGTLLKRVDVALYSAKENGRDQVVSK